MGCNGSKTCETTKNSTCNCGSDKCPHCKHNKDKNIVLYVLGGPGSGKGTQCAKLKEKFGFIHISTGDLLREEQNKDTELAKEIKAVLESGALVSSEILVKLIDEKLNTLKGQKVLLDGFPRNEENINAWNSIIKDKVPKPLVLYFNCSEETMHKRLIGRSQTSGRSDDNEEAIRQRLKVFSAHTVPVVEKYKKENMLIEIACESGPEEVFELTEKHLKERHIV